MIRPCCTAAAGCHDQLQHQILGYVNNANQTGSLSPRAAGNGTGGRERVTSMVDETDEVYDSTIANALSAFAAESASSTRDEVVHGAASAPKHELHATAEYEAARR